MAEDNALDYYKQNRAYVEYMRALTRGDYPQKPSFAIMPVANWEATLKLYVLPKLHGDRTSSGSTKGL